MAAKPRTIDEYLAGRVPGEPHGAAEGASSRPCCSPRGAEECISYGMPAFRLEGMPATKACAQRGRLTGSRRNSDTLRGGAVISIP